MKRLDDILKRCEAAPRGPLEIIGLKDAPVEAVEFYAHARTDLPLVVKALEKTMEALKFYSEMRFNRDKMEWMPGNPDKATNVLAEIEALLGNGK